MQEEIRLTFTFTEKIYRGAVHRIAAAFRRGKWINSSAPSVPVKVGIHVRRGDFLSQQSQTGGLIAAPEEYFFRAVKLLEDKIRPGRAVFLVISDDYTYCRGLFAEEKFHVFPARTPEDDMAILHLMDYVIISAGSFSWWAAFSGQPRGVIYYRDWPRPNSDASTIFTAKDYFLPDWIGIS